MTFFAALAIGLVLGRLRSAADPLIAPRVWWLLLVAAGIQVGVSWLPGGLRADVSGPGLVLTNVLVGTCLLVNALQPGAFRPAFVLATCGWALNAIVVLSNGGMPVSLAAAERAGFEPGLDVTEGFLFEHVPLTDDTWWPGLGDVIAVPAGPLSQVISLGDVLIAIAIAVAVGELSRRRGAPESRDVRKEVTT